MRKRGSVDRPPNRFEPIFVERDPDRSEAATTTRVFRDDSRSVISHNSSPDIPFDVSLNPYRGCEHGCSYCYARPSHEFLGLSAGLDFESMLFAKLEAPQLLERALRSARWTPQTLAISGVTDAYQPVENKLEITRRCLEVLAHYRNPVGIITKSSLIRRDLDLLSELGRSGAVSVTISVTTLDAELAGRLEPRAASPASRLKTIQLLAGAGIPVGVNAMPVIPGLTDHEVPAILGAAARVGASWAGYGMLRLPYGVKQIFDRWLQRHYPDRRAKVTNRIRALCGGRLNDSKFGRRRTGTGAFAAQTQQFFELARRRNQLECSAPPLDATHFKRPSSRQLSLF